MIRWNRIAWVLLTAFLALEAPIAPAAADATKPMNLLANSSFEMGRDSWDLDLAQGTEATVTVDKGEAAGDEHSALITIDKVADWGAQFGQKLLGGRVGATYTFAVLAKSTGNPVTVSLQVERAGDPWDRVGRGDPVVLKKDKWTELHITFKVEKPFPEGWFAYVHCGQARCQFRLDAVRLYEGPYTSYQQQAREAALQAGVLLFDTGTASPGPLDAAAFSRISAWTRIPDDQLNPTFKGDVVLLNSRLAVVLRRAGHGAEMYSAGPGGWKPRSVLIPVGAPAAASASTSFSSVKVLQNSSAAFSLQASFQAGGKPLVLACELKMGQVFLKTEPGQGVHALRVEAPCRFALLPDFFADDIVVDATELPVSRAELPSENFLLQMLGDGDAVLMTVWTNRDEDVAVALAGQAAARTLNATEIQYGAKGSVWVAVMTGPQVWHVRNVASTDAGKIIPLDWKQPFPAVWRVDWHRADRLADSWEMIMERPDGKFDKYGWFRSTDTIPSNRQRWATVLGTFSYPCWIDKSGRGNLQPWTFKQHATFDGPVLIYPINRVKNTPLDAFTVVDLLRATLGVGPCEYILDVEGQQSHYRGVATCGCRDTINPIYEKHQQKERRAEIEKSLDNVMIFVRHIRSRIEAYVAFGHDLSKYLADYRKTHPELAEPIGQLQKLTGAIDEKFNARKDKIKTHDQAAQLVEAFRRNTLADEGPDAFNKCKEFTAALVELGGNQDELVGECRQVVKILRQQAGIAMAVDPRMADVAREIRKRSQEVLRSPAGHEGARH